MIDSNYVFLNETCVTSNFTTLCPTGEYREIRVFTNNGPLSGIFNGPQALISELTKWHGQATAIYILPNPLVETVLGGPYNQLHKVQQGGAISDQDIAFLQWLVIDIDAIRKYPQGQPKPKGTPAAAETEKAAAHELGRNITADLTQHGWPEPLVVDTGNGMQILWRVHLPNTPANVELLRKALEALDIRYSNDAAEVDTCTYNPSRLVRLAGTMNRKGENTVERPHRMSQIIQVPKTTDTVSQAQLEELARAVPELTVSHGNSQDWLMKWIKAHKLVIAKEMPWKGKGSKWILRDCPFGGEHRPEKAFIVQMPDGAVGAGCLHSDCEGKNWHDLRDALEPGWREKKGKSGFAGKQEQADVLVKLAEKRVDLFRGTDGRAYAAIQKEDHRETYEVGSTGFKNWLINAYRGSTGKVAKAEGLSNAMSCLAAKASSSTEKAIYTRIANTGNAIYIDLCDEERNVVEVTAEGWSVIKDCPVYFRRTSGMAALPYPTRDGYLTDLKFFLNYGTKENWILCVAWLLAALRGVKPFPVLIINGAQGSAKSTTSEALRRLVDPAKIMNLRALPKDERDLAVAAANTYLLSFTNVSYISPAMSDALCRLVKGEGFSTRLLFTNADEAVFGAASPVCLDGIEDFAERADLLDRSLLVSLPLIVANQRRDEETFWQQYSEIQPGVFGALLDTLSFGLKNLPNVKLATSPRMADFARWIVACEPACPWKSGEFMEAYEASHSLADDIAFESSLVAQAIFQWFGSKEEWSGTATHLLHQLNDEIYKEYNQHKSWPTKPNALSNRLKRDLHTLASRGIKVTIPQKPTGKDRKRVFEIRKLGDSEIGRAMVIDVIDLFPYSNGGLEEEEGIDTEYAKEKDRKTPIRSITSITPTDDASMECEDLDEVVSSALVDIDPKPKTPEEEDADRLRSEQVHRMFQEITDRLARNEELDPSPNWPIR